MYDRVVLYQQKVDVVSIDKEAVRVDKFAYPTQVPVRRKTPPHDGRATFVFAPAAVAETITVDKWFAPASQPVRRAPRNPFFESFIVDPKVLTLHENVNVDKWFSPASQPVRRKRPTQDTHAVFGFPIAGETITVDKWFSPTNQPVLRRRRLPEYPYFWIDAKQLTLKETVRVDKFGYPTQMPVRRRGMMTALQAYSPFLDMQDVPAPTAPATTGGKVYHSRAVVRDDLDERFEQHLRDQRSQTEQTPRKGPEKRRNQRVAEPNTAFADQLKVVRDRLALQMDIQASLDAAQARSFNEQSLADEQARAAAAEEEALLLALIFASWP